VNAEFRGFPQTPEPGLHALLRGGLVPLQIAAYAVRLTVFAVLGTLEPVVRIALSLLALGGFATCVLYRWVLHAPHFPFGLMLLISVASAVLSVLYGALVRRLAS
jgi:hypothetical protein